MRSWQLAGAFDAGHIRGGSPDWKEELDFHQLEISGHAQQLESDYRILRDEFGLRLFRDGAWLARSFPAPDTFDWTYLDRLATLSQRQVYLSLCHYEWPLWLAEEDLLNGKIIDWMTAFAREVGRRYKNTFAAYIPVVESGYWTAMITDWGRWWPSRKDRRVCDWWQMFAVVGQMMCTMARALRAEDPHTPVALSEPWAWHPHVSMDEQARPFHVLLGRPDQQLEARTGLNTLGGDSLLLQIIGLNFYNNWGVNQGWPLLRLLVDARRRFPTQRIIMGETGNCHFSHCFSVADWLRLIDEQVEQANTQGAKIEMVTWAPVLTLGDFDWGKPAPGAWVAWDADDPARRRYWDPEVAALVRSYS